jgi:hypothetical protein
MTNLYMYMYVVKSAGISNGSFGRPAAVQLQSLAAGGAGGTMQPLAVPPGTQNRVFKQ